jgi:hypothetical protein
MTVASSLFDYGQMVPDVRGSRMPDSPPPEG